MSLRMLTMSGVRSVPVSIVDGRAARVIVADDGSRFRVRQAEVAEVQLPLFVFEQVGYFAKRGAF